MGNCTGKLVMGILALIAEFENDIRRERQMDGISKAKNRGVRFGRKPELTPERTAQIRKFRKQEPQWLTSCADEAKQGIHLSRVSPMRNRTEYQRSRRLRQKPPVSLRRPRRRLGLGEPGPLRGATPSPLEATSHRRQSWSRPPTVFPLLFLHKTCFTPTVGNAGPKSPQRLSRRCVEKRRRSRPRTTRARCNIHQAG